MPTPSGDAVFAAFRTDPHLPQDLPDDDPQLVIAEPFIRALPEILKDYLDQLVTLRALFEAKVRYAQYCLDNGILARATALLPEETGGFFSITRDSLVKMLEEQLRTIIAEIPKALDTLDSALAEAGLTEREVMLSDQVAFIDAAKALYEASTLTFGDLLGIQPGVIVIEESD